VAPVPLAVDAPTTAPVAQTAAAATAPLETAVSLGLSQTSRASVETTAQIAAQIIRNHQGRSTRFDMVLTPDSLGQVDVSLEIAADGKLAARLAFDNPLAATELRGRVDELRRQLQEAGFTVADDALSFTERDPSAAGQGGTFDRRPDPRNARAFGAGARLSADADLSAATGRWIPLALTPDRVDMKV
jgi:flagellar hook-length control protein FliK